MKAEIKSHMITNDFFTSPQDYAPENKDEFNIGFTFNIGPIKEDSSEIFDINISNKCFQKEILFSIDNIVFSKGCIQVDSYDYQKLMNAINVFIATIEFNSWNEISTELAKVFKWEFDAYEGYTFPQS